ncbi:MAG: PGPGW domain-containing protein [Actinomycetes bacterium]
MDTGMETGMETGPGRKTERMAAPQPAAPGEARARTPSSPLRRAAVAVAGTLVVALGVVLLPLPGPGMVVIVAGLGILATEFVWAERLLKRAKAYAATQAERAKQRLRDRKEARSQDAGIR